MQNMNMQVLRRINVMALVLLSLVVLPKVLTADVYSDKAKIYGKEMFACQTDADCTWAPSECCGGGMAIAESLAKTWNSFLKAKCSNQSCTMDFAIEKGYVPHCRQGKCRLVKTEDALSEEIRREKAEASAKKFEPQPPVVIQEVLPPNNEPRAKEEKIEPVKVVETKLDKKAQAQRDRIIKEKLEKQSKDKAAKKSSNKVVKGVKKNEKAQAKADKQAQLKAEQEAKKIKFKEEKEAKINKQREEKAAKITQAKEALAAKIAQIKAKREEHAAKKQARKTEKLVHKVEKSKPVKAVKSSTPRVVVVAPSYDNVECASISSRSKREACFWREAQSSTLKIGVCNELAAMNSRHADPCYIKLAEQTNNISYCHKISDPQVRFSCYHREIFSYVKDPSACEALQASKAEYHAAGYTYGTCITAAALNTQKPEVCDQIPTSNEELYKHWYNCNVAVLKKTQDPTGCDRLGNRKKPFMSGDYSPEACRKELQK